MFGYLRRKRQEIAALKARNAELIERLAEVAKAADALNDRAFLFDIRREGRTNKFIFVRGKEMHVIETMGLISDNIRSWKQTLLETAKSNEHDTDGAKDHP